MARAASIKVALGIRNWQLDVGSNWAFGLTKFTAVICLDDFQTIPFLCAILNA